MTKPTVLLTGATGFLGSHLLEALIQQDYSVVILKRSTSNLWRI
jgi:nucleoside-diphosphate-sugar epimerase